MINYSIAIMSCKPGTKKTEQTYSTKAYGTAQIHEVLDLDDFCKHIADHNSPFSKGTVKGILTDADYGKIETVIARKYGLENRNIYRGVDLLCDEFRGMMSHYKGVT